MDPNQNYRKYRDLEKTQTGPKVPFLTLYLKDLTFINDGNPNKKNNLINFSKNWQIHDVIAKMEQFKSGIWRLNSDEHTESYCSKVIALPEKRLYSYSLLCEPRNETESARLIEKWSSNNNQQ
jgi:son of sevenless-like protein